MVLRSLDIMFKDSSEIHSFFSKVRGEITEPFSPLSHSSQLRFNELRKIADAALITADPVDPYRLNTQTRALIDSYETSRNMFQTVTTDVLLSYLQYDSSGRNNIGLLQQLLVECATAVGFLETLSIPISPSDKDKLESLRGEIASLEAFDRDLFTHVDAAISEYENAHYLAATLLAGKSVVYALEQLPGKTSEDKVGRLLQAKLLKDDLKDQFLRAEKKARNYFTHDISAIPQPQEALALVAGACNLSLVLMRYKSQQ
jgi:hypothetical protein